MNIFERLAHYTNARLDDPANSQTFARRLPRKLAESRIDIDNGHAQPNDNTETG